MLHARVDIAWTWRNETQAHRQARARAGTARPGQSARRRRRVSHAQCAGDRRRLARFRHALSHGRAPAADHTSVISASRPSRRRELARRNSASWSINASIRWSKKAKAREEAVTPPNTGATFTSRCTSRPRGRAGRATCRSTIARDIPPKVGKRLVMEIDGADAAAPHRAISKRAPACANRVPRSCRSHELRRASARPRER